MDVCLYLNHYTGAITLGVGIVAAIIAAINVWAFFKVPKDVLRIQKQIEADNEKRGRQLNIFKALMATRADQLSREHVTALNMIEIEFYEEKSIRDTWDIYRKHLNSYPPNQNKQAEEDWAIKGKESLAMLLSAMAEFLNFDFDKSTLSEGAYIPITHYWEPRQEEFIRAFLIQVLKGETVIKVEVYPPKNTTH